MNRINRICDNLRWHYICADHHSVQDYDEADWEYAMWYAI